MLDLPRLDARQSNAEEMVGIFARWYPLEVLEFVLQRARREAAVDVSVVEFGARYDAVPHGGMQSVWSALQATEQHPAIVRRLLEELLDEVRRNTEPWRRGALEIAGRIMVWDSEVEAALREWMQAGRCEDIALIGRVFSDLPSFFVIEQRQFVIDLLSWSAQCAATVREQIRVALLSSISRTARMRTRGEPNAVDTRLHAEATAITNELLARGTPAASHGAGFYREVAEEAARHLVGESERDERDIHLSETLDWDDFDF